MHETVIISVNNFSWAIHVGSEFDIFGNMDNWGVSQQIVRGWSGTIFGGDWKGCDNLPLDFKGNLNS